MRATWKAAGAYLYRQFVSQCRNERFELRYGSVCSWIHIASWGLSLDPKKMDALFSDNYVMREHEGSRLNTRILSTTL